MRIREIKQHNLFSIIVVLILLFSDILSYYIAYNSVIFIKAIDSSIINNPILIVFGIVFLFYFFSRYNPSSMQSRSKEIKVLFNLVSVSTFFYLIYKILFIKINISQAQNIVLLSLIFFIISIVMRLTIRTIQKQLLKLNIGLRKAVIIGSAENTEKLINQMNKINILGYKIIGYFDFSDDSKISKTYKYLGNFNNLNSFLINNHINEVFITLDKKDSSLLSNIISDLKNLNVCIKIIPNIYDVLTGQAKMHSVTGMPLIDIDPNILTEFQFLLKRILDILISFFGIIIMFPFFIILTLIIKWTSTGPVIFKQKRVGLNGKEFIVHKLRTMHIDSEKNTGPVWATKEDPRITKIGRYLRKLRIDEFPQLYDVLIGNMSIVGPRPEREFFVSKLREKFPYYQRRLNVRPGITGWAQIMGSYDTDLDNVENKLKLDFYYIENISIWLDIKIMIITLWIIIRAKGH